MDILVDNVICKIDLLVYLFFKIGMDSQIMKVKQMKLDTLKSRAERILSEINNLTALESAISEFDKNIDDSRHILNELEKKNQTLASELMTKEMHHKEQNKKYEQYNRDSVVIVNNIKDLDTQIELLKLQNLSLEENIRRERERFDKIKLERERIDKQAKKYNDMWKSLVDAIKNFTNPYYDGNYVDDEVKEDSIIDLSPTVNESAIFNIEDDSNFPPKIIDISDCMIIDKNNFSGHINVTELDCHNSCLTEIKYLPPTLKILRCENTKLNKIHYFPDDLEQISLNNNELKELPKLPEGLEELWCKSNKLVNLPDLPSSLKKIGCYNNNIEKLPNLPKSLIYLGCNNNKLTELPVHLPNLEHLDCGTNNLQSLPGLPSTIKTLYIHNNIKISNIPNIPKSLIQIKCYGTGINKKLLRRINRKYAISQ